MRLSLGHLKQWRDGFAFAAPLGQQTRKMSLDLISGMHALSLLLDGLYYTGPPKASTSTSFGLSDLLWLSVNESSTMLDVRKWLLEITTASRW